MSRYPIAVTKVYAHLPGWRLHTSSKSGRGRAPNTSDGITTRYDPLRLAYAPGRNRAVIVLPIALTDVRMKLRAETTDHDPAFHRSPSTSDGITTRYDWLMRRVLIGS